MSDNNNYYPRAISDEYSVNNLVINPLMPRALNWPTNISSDHLMLEGPVEEVDENEINSYITITKQGIVGESPRNLGEFDSNDWRFTPSPQMVPPLPEPHREGTSRPRIQVNSTHELFSTPPVEQREFAQNYSVDNPNTQEQPANPDIMLYFNNNDNEVDYKKMFTVCLENEVKMGEELVEIAERLRKIGKDMIYK
ncbi:hypothetical protein L1987_07019 [Smallanthus sonchifolius]|uniref:Uncharacterized protein n=1 Tax=Smallanthus sonchifolius TaxID=185202 RepID=A0ACB9K042_9ASTR|nr:hypothetical protein L1987_07019 [Smallanthus sonchifolius]